MPEFRQNLATKEWIILAPERGKRPSQYIESRPIPVRLPQHLVDCPFCPGNEDKIVTPVYVAPECGDWQVRVVPNKYAALQPHLPTTRNYVGTFLSAMGFGIAEVVIEHARHDLSPALMHPNEIAAVLRAYRERQIAISRNEKINLVMIFRNFGERAGTSLEHPHSQIIATPIVPPHIRFPIEQAVMHYDKNGTCVYCDMVKEELRQGDRVIVNSKNFVAFCPFAARSPFECRIYPKWHAASYVSIEDSRVTELAQVLSEVLRKIYYGLKNPDYNYIIRSSPIGDEDTRYLHWYMVIIPKVSIPAGFEIGSGIYINTMPPEESAHFLRQTVLP